MGAKQSKRSVDITTTPKKGDGEVMIGEGEGKVEKIAELDVNKATTNGAVHPEIEFADKDDNVKEQSDKGDIKENGVSEPEDDGKTAEDGDVPAAGDQINESTLSEKTTPTENNDENKNKSSTIEETTENKKNKEKSKKKKWSLRSISFSKKDKSKPSKESEKNGDVKEINEENAAETSPSGETPKTDEPKVPVGEDDATATPITTTNGDASAEELAKVDDKPKDTVIAEEEPVVKEEPAKVPEPAESAPSPIKEEPSKIVEEPTPKVEESKPVVEITNTTSPDNVVEESKEVRTEDVPPPLPSSNPPSPVTVFAESTKADNNLNEISPPVDNKIKTPVETSDVVANIVDETPNIESISKTEIEPVESIASTENLPSLPQESESVKLFESVSDIPLPDDNVTKETDSSLPDKTELVAPVADTIPDKEIVTENIPASEPKENTPLVEQSVESSKSETCPIQNQQTITEKDPVSYSLEAEVSKQEIPSITPMTETVKDLPSALIETVPSEMSVQNVDNCTKTETVADLPNVDVSSSPVPPTPIEKPELEENISSPVQDVPPTVDISTSIENPESTSVHNADSFPDISTESLPSLPEPVSESLPEPMSLPPVESFPEPIANDPSTIVPDLSNSSSVVDNLPPSSPLPKNETVLTNGNMNGLPSPVVINDEIVPPVEGPLKQVPTEVPESQSEIAAAVESTQNF